MSQSHFVPLPSRAALEERLQLTSDAEDAAGIPLFVCASLEEAIQMLPERADAVQSWAKTNGFTGASGQMLLLPSPNGALEAVLVGSAKGKAANAAPGFAFGSLGPSLPEGVFHLREDVSEAATAYTAAVLGNYKFEGIGPGISRPVSLAVQDASAREFAIIQAMGVVFGRDLINTPANLLGPVALGEVTKRLADAYGADHSLIVGEDLLDPENPFPLIHTVGAAAKEEPRLADISWAGPGTNEETPLVTLVGKGVCFDTGGLNLKPGNAMSLMKKDMGGAAAVLGLALMIMEAKLSIRLRVLVPIVENSIASPSFRPSDILTSRKGLTVEVGNTDAEGRLILADALALADEDKPDLMVDMATLTGAARVALGPDLPPYFTNDEALAQQIASSAEAVEDPVWRMPLWPRYEQAISGKVADISNTGSMPFAGAITAALFLKRFVERTPAWVHFDIYGWNPSSRPGRPEGGEPQAIRALFKLISDRYAGKD